MISVRVRVERCNLHVARAFVETDGFHERELASRFEEGFDAERSIPADDAELRPPRGTFLVASADGESLACGAVKTISPGVGSLKRMWVARTARGLGLGRRMLLALESQTWEIGLTTL